MAAGCSEYPADDQHAELGTPVAEVIVRDDPVAHQPQDAGQRVAQDRRADMADVHGFGDVGRTEIHDHRARLGGLLEERVLAPRRRLQSLRQRGRFEAEIQEAGAGNVHLLTPIADLELGDHVSR